MFQFNLGVLFMTETIKSNLRRSLILFCISGTLFLMGCSSDDDSVASSGFSLTSSASDGGFDPGGVIPDEFRYDDLDPMMMVQCDGENNFPKLAWGDSPPTGTEGFALIVDDPVGGDWVHLNLYDIPKSRLGIPRLEDLTPMDHFTFGSDYGTAIETDWMYEGWAGPCPPTSTGTHTYYFKLYAMSENPLSPAPAMDMPATRSEFETTYEAKILGSTEISGEATFP